ncbi:GDSL-type esterase/lipase family protein [Paenibacillus ginsengarvi]|uniref:SGNH hydrolase-type esterase domain-containing protein n=1 Tax=Paenibacillus ginsengarvi TaxID=400777 RepID=A0A3B0C394_9BACL|nr:GDSL-type esterase/lipase family protein [Paenibacillus ginsengarvi]RKN80503.1 hypothetical protein D7M11_20390 [Paenibacillus ginsengarvi]
MGTLLERNSSIPDGRRIVFLGDSITDNGLFIAYMESYFMKHMPETRIQLMNLGVSSETASGLSEPDHPYPRPCVFGRLARALRESRPDWVVFGYGMNDGIYHPFSEERFEAYKEGILSLIRAVRETGAKAIAMTPPPFEYESVRRSGENANGASSASAYSWYNPYPDYNNVLRTYKEWLTSLREADAVVNIFDPLERESERRRGQGAPGLTGDGIHPGAEGHWLIARTLLAQLFNVHLQRVPAFAAESGSPTWAKALRERNILLHEAWKEHVGHANPNKAKALPLEEAIRKGDELAEAIRTTIMEQANDCGEETVSQWNGYVRADFYVSGREALVIAPEQAAPGVPWVWRTEFFDAFAYADRELLRRGWHIAYCRISNMYGCPGAVSLMHDFHTYAVGRFGLAEKAALFGFSRGGLYAFHYAAAHPEHTAALYLDAPVLDMRSWPGGRWLGSGDAACWQDCLAVYGLTEQTVDEYDRMPLHLVSAVAAAGIPILLVAGDSDDVVPYGENGALLDKLYRTYGGTMDTIVKPGVGHHPHSLENPAPIVEFIERHAGIM